MGARRGFRYGRVGRVVVTWRGVKLVIEVAFVAAILVALVVINGNANRSEAIIQAQYNSCVMAIPFLKKFNVAMEGAETVADVLLTNAEAMHAITEPGTPVYRQQEINIARLRRAIDSGSGVRIPVPTRKVCEQRRDDAL